MEKYKDLIREILENGEERTDRTGVGTLSIFGYMTEFDLQEGFPLLTSKKMHLKGIVTELEWFMRGDTGLKYLIDRNTNIWNDDAYRYYRERTDDLTLTKDEFVKRAKEGGLTEEDLDLGDVYGKQWRKYGEMEVDQLVKLVEGINTNPTGRRHIINAWNPSDIEKGELALPPCHVMTQWYVRDGKYLDLQLYVRSNDVFLGMPYNIASYAIMAHIIAEMTGYEVGKFKYVIGDAHLYLNHIEQAKELLERETYELPKLVMEVSMEKNDTIKDVFDTIRLDVEVEGYKCNPPLRAQLNVGLEECKK